MKIAILIAYACILLVIGFVSMRKTKTASDFVVGGRTIGPWISAFSYGTTYFSAVIFIGYAGKSGWGFGLSDLWIVIGNACVGSFLAWKLLARRTRSMTKRLDAITMPQFLSQRYQSPKMKALAALVIFVFLVPYSSSVYMGLSYLFESVLGIPYKVALFGIAIITCLYLVMGGYFAVTMTDFFLGILMIFGVGALLYYTVGSPQVGGWGEIVPRLQAVDPVLTTPFGPDKLALFSLVFLTSVGTWGLPQMTQKFYAVKNEKIIKTATWVTFILCGWIAFGAYFNGALSRLFFPSLDAVGGNVDLLVPNMIAMTVPDAVAVLILLLVLAASMSTLASLVLVSSSAVAMDLTSVVFPQAPKKYGVLWLRILCVLFIAVSLYLALIPNVIVTLMAFSWGAVAGTFLAPYVLGLFSRKITTAGAWAGMITGFTFCSIFSLLFPAQVPVIGCLSMIIPVIVVLVVSRFTKPLSEEFLNRIFDGKRVRTEAEETTVTAAP